MTKDIALLIVEDDPVALASYIQIMGLEFPEILVHGAAHPEEAISLVASLF